MSTVSSVTDDETVFLILVTKPKIRNLKLLFFTYEIEIAIYWPGETRRDIYVSEKNCFDFCFTKRKHTLAQENRLFEPSFKVT